MGEERGEDRWLSIKQAAQYLGVKVSTIYGYQHQGLLPYKQLSSGGGRRMRLEDVRKMLIDPPQVPEVRVPEGEAE